MKTLEDVEYINWVKVTQLKKGMPRDEWKKLRDDEKFIVVNHETNTISVKIQTDPVSEVGINGCQIDELIELSRLMLEKFNEDVPCKFNENAIKHLEGALEELDNRRKDRENRGVEGTNDV